MEVVYSIKNKDNFVTYIEVMKNVLLSFKPIDENEYVFISPYYLETTYGEILVLKRIIDELGIQCYSIEERDDKLILTFRRK